MISFDHFKRCFAVVRGVVIEIFVVQIKGKRLMDDGIVIADQNARMFIHADITSSMQYSKGV